MVARTYLFVYFGAGLFAQLAVPVVARIAQALDLTDKPDPRKVHRHPIPRIGGVAIFGAVMALTLPVLALDNAIGESFRQMHSQVTALLLTSFLVFVVGLLDDVLNLPGRLKLVTLVAAASALAATGARIESISVEPGFTLQFGWLSWPITVLWIVGITVAMNFIDGLDGLASGIAAIVTGVIALFAFSSGQVVMGVLMLALLGALTGFLFFNWNPAKIFMGDCGSMFLGYFISAGSVVCQAKTSALVGLALPALALGVPLFDTMLTMVRRKVLDRRSIFAAERGHIHHRLLDMGLNQRSAVILIYAVSFGVATLGMLLFFTRGAETLAVLAAGALVLLMVFRVAGASRLRETCEALRRNASISHECKRERAQFEDAQLKMRRATSLDEWWNALCDLAEGMAFDRLALVRRRNGETITLFVWLRGDKPVRTDDVVNVIMPLGYEAGQNACHIELAARKTDRLESVGRRTALFGRLLDEHRQEELTKPAPFVDPATSAATLPDDTPSNSGRGILRPTA